MEDALKNKIYLSKFSIIKYRDYCIELLRNVDFVLVEYFEDELNDYQNIKFENKKVYIRREYLEKVSIVRLSLDLVKALKRHFEDLYIFEKKKVVSSNKLKYNGENDVAIDDIDGNRDEEKWCK